MSTTRTTPTDYGWGLFRDDDKSGGTSATRYRRTYEWDEKNRLISSVDANYSTAYVYGHDGQRSNKYTQSSETLYFNKMWTLHTDSGNSVYGGQTAKNIYLGETRIVTKLNSGSDPTYQEEYYKQYYYHGDHLGSASLISDYKGDEYQRIEYTPYGETWVEKTSNTGLEFLPYKFTAKELDKETRLYYYGARYLDPKYSRWISTDPALGEYIPGVGKGTVENFSGLPGMGGVYNTVNGNLYHYAGNNPVKYTDPDGRNANYAIDDENHTVTIIVPSTIYGNEVSEETARIYTDGINRAWAGDWTTTINGQEYSVSISADVYVGEEPSNPSRNDSMNYIKVDENNTRSFVTSGFKGEWRKEGRSGRTLQDDNPAPHETGHLLGLTDRYHDVQVDGKTQSRSNEGWENNIMGGGSLVEQKNIDGIMKSIPDPSRIKSGVLQGGRMNN